MENIKKLIIILIIIILIIIGILYYIISYKKEKNDFSNHINEEAPVVYKKEAEDVINYSQFYMVEQCINKYIINFIKEDETYYTKEEIEENNKSKKNKIKAMLDEKYLEDINIEDIFNTQYPIGSKFSAKSMKILESENIDIYSVYGVIKNANTKEKELNLFYKVRLDRKNGTFSIEPIKQIKNIDEIELKIDTEKIDKNVFNVYTSYNRIKEEEIVQRYFNDFKEYLLDNSDKAYEYLNIEYRNKRFPTLDDFKSYVKDKYKELLLIKLNAYQVNNYKDYKEYICKDQFENLYIFNTNIPLEYTVKLDNYTIATEDFEKTYKNSNENQKVSINTEKWIQMLNNKDYNSAFNVLDDSFKNNNFKNKEVFRQYINQNYSEHYKIESSNIEQQGEIYLNKITLRNIKTNQIEKEITIIMKLNEGTDFVMSFNK